jgi:tRNA dimethylallyltransferase
VCRGEQRHTECACYFHSSGPQAADAMLPPPFDRALVLTGPTGSGKTQLGIELARRLDAEIISMDSMALYRGMDIGTAKPTPDERRDIPHHLIDVLDPWESASVAWWLERARAACADIEARGKQVLFVGGTPLYLKTLMFGLFEGPPADRELRRRLTEEAERLGVPALHQRLAAVDPASADRIHVNDLRRIIRALEVYEATARPISAWQTQWGQESGVRSQESGKPSASLTADFCLLTPVLWLDVPRAELYERINRRVDDMFAAGLVDEVRGLRDLGRPLSREASQALGYKEVLAYLDGRQELAAAIELVKTRSRNFAKRQITWFRHLPGCRAATSQLTQALWQPKMK